MGILTGGLPTGGGGRIAVGQPRCVGVVAPGQHPLRLDRGDRPAGVRSEGGRSSSRATGCGPVWRPAPLKHATISVPPSSGAGGTRHMPPARRRRRCARLRSRAASRSAAPGRSRWRASASATAAILGSRGAVRAIAGAAALVGHGRRRSVHWGTVVGGRACRVEWLEAQRVRCTACGRTRCQRSWRGTGGLRTGCGSRRWSDARQGTVGPRLWGRARRWGGRWRRRRRLGAVGGLTPPCAGGRGGGRCTTGCGMPALHQLQGLCTGRMGSISAP